MYLTKIEIEDLRAIRRLVWEVPDERAVGWHVVLGPNGSGKSSFVRGAALAVLEDFDIFKLPGDPNDWIRHGAEMIKVRLKLMPTEGWEDFAGEERPLDSIRSIPRVRDLIAEKEAEYGGFEVYDQEEGFFSAAFGPYRRFVGGHQKYEKLMEKHPRLAWHISAFEEDFAFSDCLLWLEDLKFKQLEGKEEGDLLVSVTEFINQEGFLPFGTKLEDVSSDGVVFVDGAGSRISIEDLSDGYRSILSLTLELVRQLSRAFGPERLFRQEEDGAIVVDPPGVVLIDEIDAHLHPSWQREIGFWLRRHFPNLQFIVTTHSPIICHAASEGSVFVLPEPGSEEEGRMLEGAEYERLVYGNVLEAYGTEAFGSSGDRSREAQEKLDRLAELNLQELSEGLSEAERQERDRLRATFPTEPHPLAERHAQGS